MKKRRPPKKPLGPYAKGNQLSNIDGRTRAARLAKQTRTALTAHVGGRPSATQTVIIERACQLTVRIGAMDAKFAATGEQTEHDSRTYLAWSASLTRLLRDLGMKAVADRVLSLREHIEKRAAP